VAAVVRFTVSPLLMQTRSSWLGTRPWFQLDGSDQEPLVVPVQVMEQVTLGVKEIEAGGDFSPLVLVA
jgi:hypothetical protein